MYLGRQKQKGDTTLPSHKKDDLLVQWNETKHRNSPQVSPYSYDAEGEDSGDEEAASDSEDEESEEEENNALVFDSDEINEGNVDDLDDEDFADE